MTKKTKENTEITEALATIPVDIINQTLQYLSEKPFKEVQGLILAIQEKSKLI